jgi:hypothetical protein
MLTLLPGHALRSAEQGTELAGSHIQWKGTCDPEPNNYKPREQGEPDGQRPIVAGPFFECFA